MIFRVSGDTTPCKVTPVILRGVVSLRGCIPRDFRVKCLVFRQPAAPFQNQFLELFVLEFFSDNLLVRIHSIIEMIWWTGLAPWDSLFQVALSPPSEDTHHVEHGFRILQSLFLQVAYRVCSKLRTHTALVSYGRAMPRSIGLSYGRCVSLISSNPCTAMIWVSSFGLLSRSLWCSLGRSEHAGRVIW